MSSDSRKTVESPSSTEADKAIIEKLHDHWENKVGSIRTKIDKEAAQTEAGALARLFGLFIILILVLGWRVKDLELYVPNEGLGYWLGIIGGSLMLILLLYPLRKTAKWMRGWGNISYWFNIHMIFGILGPTLIIFHCNFQLGAFNSNVAFFSMLIVMFSGIVGRYIFIKINFNLAREKVTLNELQDRVGISRDDIRSTEFILPEVKEHLEIFEFKELVGSIWRSMDVFTIKLRSRLIKFTTMRLLKAELGKRAVIEGWPPLLLQQRIEDDRKLINGYLDSVLAVVEFTAYRRLFSLWHVVHIPLFIMLIVTATVHVIAVHLY